MGISTSSDYVNFFLSLNMGKDASLTSFVNNEKRVIKLKMENKNTNKERLQNGLNILNELSEEISTMGENKVLEKYNQRNVNQ